MTKQDIRSRILLKLRNQKEEKRNKKSNKIKIKLFRTKEFINAKTVMFYVAFDGEVNTEDMIHSALKLGKTIVVPVCERDKITIRPCLLKKNTKLKKGLYGIWEPAVKRFIRAKDIDLVVVPGVAFDKSGNRLGRGKGCYDRFLKLLPKSISSIGLGFDFQILPSLPATTHDVKVNKVIFA
ncbi:MAG: 5-formyltetrahydrofolate cyclo-ligase [Candidatus Omnitrophica bacterium]|nr:5-formyltetrahydrofolate cyclo-ligase [Candidatus Omnitrophota bacterium]